MKLKKISCDQFAGVRDREVELQSGLNIICGKNESGKSTLVNLISRTLFQNSQIDGRRDKQFKELYFPSAQKGSKFDLNTVDGTLAFETENGIYKLSKVWGDGSGCKLSAPEGVLRDEAEIEKMLKDVLVYGEGVYSEMLLSSQRNADVSLKTILDASAKSDAKQEIAHAVSQAFAESDGIPVDRIEQAICAKIEEIEGKHWDFEKQAPVRKAGRWASGLGEILKACYEQLDAQEVLDTVSRLQEEADRAGEKYTREEKEAGAAQAALDDFGKYASLLAVQAEQKKNISRLKAEIEKEETDAREWPVYTAALEQAKQLKKEEADRAAKDRCAQAESLADRLNSLNGELLHRQCPTAAQISDVKKAQKNITALENALCGMNLNAVVHMLNGHKVEVRSLRTGEQLDISGGSAQIKEAVEITVPGVMELQLAPADVNVAQTEQKIAGEKNAMVDVLDQFSVKTLEELEALAKNISEEKNRYDLISQQLKPVLADKTMEELQAAAAAVGEPVRSAEEIKAAIQQLCKGTALERYIGAQENKVSGYQENYGTQDALKNKISEEKAELKQAEANAAMAEEIPEEYRRIPNPELHQNRLKQACETHQAAKEDALAAKTAAGQKLQSYQESLAADPREEFSRAQQAFERQKTLLAHWKHIEEVFRQQKQQIHENPMEDMTANFAKYLGIISQGRISTEFPQEDKLDMNIYSGKSLIDYEKLSEGTKETVSLAFRLAVLDHLFPEGGGLIVLDDPFADMDKERTEQGCRLLEECAKRHQVLFLTCKEEYLDKMQGNCIRF